MRAVIVSETFNQFADGYSAFCILTEMDTGPFSCILDI